MSEHNPTRKVEITTQPTKMPKATSSKGATSTVRLISDSEETGCSEYDTNPQHLGSDNVNPVPNGPAFANSGDTQPNPVNRLNPIITNGEPSTNIPVKQKDPSRKRRSQSESSEGSPRSKSLQETDVSFMWSQTNGHAVSEIAVNGHTSPLSPDVFYSSSHPSPRTTDDMNGYISANSHLLAYLDINRESSSDHPANHENREHNELSLGESNANNHQDINQDDSLYDKIDEGIALAAELEYIPIQTKLSTSSEDQGDFIETDISLQQFNSYTSSQESSCENLPNLVHASCQEHHNNNKSECYPHLLHNCESCDKNLTGAIANISEGNSYEPCRSKACISPGNSSNSRPVGYNMSAAIPQDAASSQDQQQQPSWSRNNPAPHHANHSSSSSYLSPDMDIEFMDFDIDPGLVNSDSQQDSLSTDPGCWNNEGPPRSQERTSSHESKIENCFCCGCCDKLSDKFSNHSSHFKPQTGSKSSPMISCCRNHRKERLNDPMQQVHTEANEGESSDTGHSDEPGQGIRNALAWNEEDRNNLASNSAADFSPDQQLPDLVPITNNLDVVFSHGWTSSDVEAEHYNVSRQTSTSNFDQDENSFQDFHDGSDWTKSSEEMNDALQVVNRRLSSSCNLCEGNEELPCGALLKHDQLENLAFCADVYDPQEADDEEDEGTPPPIPNKRPPLNRRLELLEAHNQNLEQSMRHEDCPPCAPIRHSNSENEELAGAVGGADYRPGATNFNDDESPGSAIRLLEYQFVSDDIEFNRRYAVMLFTTIVTQYININFKIL